MNELVEMVESANTNRLSASFDTELFDRIILALSSCFHREATLMEATDYQDRHEHINEHRIFIETLTMMRDEGEVTVRGSFTIRYITDWIKYHLNKYDKPLSNFVTPRGGATRVSDDPAAGLQRPKGR